MTMPLGFVPRIDVYLWLSLSLSLHVYLCRAHTHTHYARTHTRKPHAHTHTHTHTHKHTHTNTHTLYTHTNTHTLSCNGREVSRLVKVASESEEQVQACLEAADAGDDVIDLSTSVGSMKVCEGGWVASRDRGREGGR